MQRILNGKTVMYLLTKSEKADEKVNEFLKSEIQRINELGYKPFVMVSGKESLEYNTEVLVLRNKEEAERDEAAICEDIAI